MHLYDAHVHLADKSLAGDTDGVLARMRERGIEGGMIICDPCADSDECDAALQIARAHTEFAVAAGCHPLNAVRFDADALLRALAQPECACVGEIGLDYSGGKSTRDAQLAALVYQLDCAYEMRLPAQLHIRDAHGDMLDLLRECKRRGCLPECIVHGFSRGRELAAEYMRLGARISVGGALFYKCANRLFDAVRTIPEDRLMIETDAPFGFPRPECLADVYERVRALRAGEM